MSADPQYALERLQEIAELDLLSADVDPMLQDIARQTATHLSLPVSLISVVLDDALHVAGSHGLDGLWLGETRGHPVEWSFCATSVRTREAYVVERATEDAYHRTNPLVVQDGVRCYAGVPLISSRGFVLGNLCVVGLEERTFTVSEVAFLHDMAKTAVARIEERRTRGAVT
ncbi:GAF domain-containing protein [Gemmatimonas groenlandica]|uniref:GAF domain-containing protein n=1 Tax=Gemmatimonas groenlandica TaxID=2732249 RepID=A0A6M4IST8_9BACT|nr:GAF domain-containing protein [Gemmatimonas groenlandica]QJR36536.1 GAF domain-containing protein [Gemmatimonas groenlandica]